GARRAGPRCGRADCVGAPRATPQAAVARRASAGLPQAAAGGNGTQRARPPGARGDIMDTMVVPAAATTQSPTALMHAMAPGSVPRPPRRPLYTLPLWPVALLSCLLPGPYFGRVAAWGCPGYTWYAEWAPRQISGWALVAWTVPGFVIGVLILFLLKPLIAPRASAPDPLALPESESAFRAAVLALCRAVGVAQPRAIHLS